LCSPSRAALLTGRDHRTAAALAASMTVLRLAQDLVFGLILQPTDRGADESDSGSAIVSSILLVVALLLLLTA
jgi:hypothetical protein